MSCFSPLMAHRRRDGTVGIGAPPRGSPSVIAFELPCGVCVGCHKAQRRAWSIRIVHEAQLWDQNLFCTLTYRDFPYKDPDRALSPSLDYREFQKFMKRLRRFFTVRRVNPATGRLKRYPSRRVRFFVAGEYGARLKRPHYHAILFNCWMPDQVRLQNGHWRSAKLEELWSHGDVDIGSVTPASASYVAGYSSKKVYGIAAREAYEDLVDMATGEALSRTPEFVKMSLKPGIGGAWYEKYGGDLFPLDRAVQDGRCYKVPRYYVEKYKLRCSPGELEVLLSSRDEKAREGRKVHTLKLRAMEHEAAQRAAAFYSPRDTL